MSASGSVVLRGPRPRILKLAGVAPDLISLPCGSNTLDVILRDPGFHFGVVTQPLDETTRTATTAHALMAPLTPRRSVRSIRTENSRDTFMSMLWNRFGPSRGRVCIDLERNKANAWRVGQRPNSAITSEVRSVTVRPPAFEISPFRTTQSRLPAWATVAHAVLMRLFISETSRA